MAQYVKPPKGGVILILSEAEAKGLEALAHDGATGILSDAAAASAYVEAGRPRWPLGALWRPWLRNGKQLDTAAK